MLSTKERSTRRTVHDMARVPAASDTILGYTDRSLHDAKIVYRSQGRGGGASSSMLFQYENKNEDENRWKDSRSTLHRHSDGTLLNSTFGKLPIWMTKPGLENYRRYRSIPNFLAGEPYGYSNNVYEAAAMIFERLAIKKDGGQSLIQYGKTKDEDREPLKFGTPKIKRQAFELAYQALKYQELLEEILINSSFLFAHPMADDQMALVVVMLYDYQNRKWAPRCRVIGEEIDQEIAVVENALYDHKIRLAAALAKCRVKNQSLSIDYVLPETVRQQEKCASTLPQSTWVNTLKTSVDDVAKKLVELGYCEVCGKQENLLPLRGKYFHRDSHCEDVVLFPWDQKEALKSLEIVSDGLLILQDKTSSLAVQAISSLLTEDDEYDILHTEVASGLTTAHLAIILHNMTKNQVETRGKMYSHPLLAHRVIDHPEEDNEAPEQHRPTVYACGVRDSAHRTQLEDMFSSLGISNVKLLSEKFEDIHSDGDPRFERLKLILCTPQCTRTAVSNPIEFMLMEGDKETYNILRDLSHGRHNNHATEAGKRHLTTMKHALKFRTLQACVYVARSVHEEENEHVVNAAIKWQRQHASGSMPFRICPPTVPLMNYDMRNQNMQSLSSKFLYLRQSPTMNGCFLAVISREMGTDELTVKDIIRRAALKGLVKPLPNLDIKSTVTKSILEPQHVDSDDEKKKPKKKTSNTSQTTHTSSGRKSSKPASPSKSSKALHKMSETKTVDASDVNRLLGLYNTKHSNTKIPEEKSEEVAHVNLNLDFDKPNTMRFQQSTLPDHTKKPSREKVHRH
ncbi:putative methyltransferase NSUN7 isoform X1 [Styela clava]